ncbi:MAG: isochorismate synthase [Verrucomicrobia bacterium]|nr:isochorismate synthase [Verrucomicrobiota bacterium]
MDLLSWLKRLDFYPKIYWKERSSSRTFAAAGFGGPSSESYSWRHFAPTDAAHWADFPFSFRFSPKVSCRVEESESRLKLTSPNVKRFSYAPNRQTWDGLVERALEAIRKKRVDKVVLGRECTLELETAADPWSVVAELQRKASNAYVFCLQPTPRSAYLGATPERLFSRKNEEIFTEALAGTRKLGRADLLDNPKDRREFSFVEESIRDALSPLAQNPFEFSVPRIRATSFVQHIYSQLNAILKPKTKDSKILDRLHPTAALSGYPKREAMHLLKRWEPFERGLYGAPIGRTDGDESEWIVGIRSCLLFGPTARLYSGTGIVEGSDPEAEWEELDSKLGLYEGIFL